MAHNVTCVYCNQIFDRDKEPFVQIANRRYAHKKCVSLEELNRIKEEQDLKALEDYIKKLFNLNVINAKIRKQIRDYKQDYGYTYSGILKTLYFWYGIHKNDVELGNKGIGI